MAQLKSIVLYEKLIEKINHYEANLLEKYSNDITCRKGCDSCCILESVFPVEAYAIYESIRSGERAHQIISGDTPGRCVFLREGSCSIYMVRPVICRTHGYPVYIDGKVDFCPENFKGRSAIDSENILSLDNLNSALASINLIFSGEVEDEFFKRERIPLKELAEFVINNK